MADSTKKDGQQLKNIWKHARKNLARCGFSYSEILLQVQIQQNQKTRGLLGKRATTAYAGVWWQKRFDRANESWIDEEKSISKQNKRQRLAGFGKRQRIWGEIASRGGEANLGRNEQCWPQKSGLIEKGWQSECLEDDCDGQCVYWLEYHWKREESKKGSVIYDTIGWEFTRQIISNRFKSD